MAQPHPKISKAKARLLLAHPFFATLLVRTQVIVTDAVMTAATDGKNHYYNPQLLEDSTVEEVMSDLVHEACHDSFLHSVRKGDRNPEIANYAMDYAINIVLEDCGFKAPKGGWLVDQKYKGWYWERIYDDLRRNPPKSGAQGRGPAGPGMPGQGPNGESIRLYGDVLPSPAATPAEKAQAEQAAKQKIASAANMARMAGKMPASLAALLDGLLESRVPWTDVLRDKMLKVVKSREAWVRRNRRFKHIYLPTRHERKMGPIVFVPDTSGSMWGKGGDLDKVCSEMAHCATQTRPENIRVIWADARVSSEQVFESYEEFSFQALKPTGGGGTDMRVPLKHAEQYDPQVVVLMTDGYTPWPADEPPFPLIVLCTTDVTVPWGEVIRI